MFQVAGCDIADLERWGASHSSHEVALEGERQKAHRRLTESGQHSCSEAQLSGPSHRLQVDAPAPSTKAAWIGRWQDGPLKLPDAQGNDVTDDGAEAGPFGRSC